LFEATTSNILINHNDVFYFVPNQSLVIHGITQRILEEQLPILGMRVQHTPKTLSTIKSHGHEYRVWLLNQVSGATSVATLDDIKLDVDEVKTSWLNSILENYGKKNGRIFCEKKP
jgi:branched-subunit amino acid aminotransferase/4-amino-4-deoxychorismate lyase